MTLQTIFNRCMLLDNQLDLISGGDDVTRGLTCANMVIDWLEAEAATVEGVLTTHDLLYTVANTEHTDWPAELLRLDALWLLDATTGRPAWEIEPIQGIGNHVPGYAWPLSELLMSGTSSDVTGKPKEYTASGPGGQFYWSPLPDDAHTVRGYGLWAVEDLEDATSLFPYPQTLAVSFPAMMVQVLRIGLDRPLDAIASFAKATFRPALKGLHKFNRTVPESRVYYEPHEA